MTATALRYQPWGRDYTAYSRSNPAPMRAGAADLSVPSASLAAMKPGERALRSFLLSQRGVLTREQALACGISAHGIAHRIRRGGPWLRLLPGIYLTATGAPTWDQLQTAALLHAGAGSVITGPAALCNYGIRRSQPRRVDVLIPHERERQSAKFAAIHRTRRMPETVAVDLALRFAPAERAVADTVRQLADLAETRAVVAAAVQLGRCSIADLAAELRAGPVRGSARLRSVLAEVIAGIRSAPEGDLRDLIRKSGLPQPLYNPRLYVGDVFLAQPDAWWPEYGVAVEVDSREWHLSPADWERTMARHRRMSAAGIIVLHISPRQLRDQQADAIAEIAGALRSGRSLPAVTTRPLAA
jgi:hypothetical protein